MMSYLTRRQFLRQAGGAAVASGVLSRRAPAGASSANEKLDVAVIGCGGRGYDDLQGVASAGGVNIVALCDVDQKRGGRAFQQYPQAKRFRDFRRMFDAMDKQIDAVVVGTPDHTHASASVMAMRLGKHCYCEKPLTRSVFEARTVAEVAAQQGVATQMGTQIHALDNYRRAVELVRSGVIGTVGEVHVWLGANFQGPPQPTGGSQPDAPNDSPPVPETLDWDLWLGPAPYRPYHPAYAPFGWRYWWAFANGQLGDFFCHYCDLAFWALQLRHPTTIEARGPLHPESTPRWTIARQEYPARGQLPPVTLSWYHGGAYPLLAKEVLAPPDRWNSAVLFVGSQGMLLADYHRRKLLPEKEFEGFEPPQPTIPASIGHHREWVEACRSGGPTTCNFDYAGALTEAALLCNVALRVGKPLQWDAQHLKAVNCPEADAFLKRPYRSGWTL